MSTAVRPRASAGASDAEAASSAAGRRLVVFGITGDLAKVMTFHSLYRLERRGLLDCPIVGVAVDDWTVDDLRERARERDRGHAARRSTTTVFDALRRAALLRAAATSATPRTYERVAARDRRRAQTPVFYLEIPPFLFGTVVKGLAEAGLTGNARVVVEKPFGHDLASARALADEIHQYLDESQLYRIDHFLGKMGLDEILYLRFANAMLRADLEPQLRLVRADHDGRGLRRRGPRALLRPGRRAARRGRQPPDAGRRRRRDGAARRRRRRRRSRTRSVACSGRCPTPTRRTTCAASTTATATSTASRRTRRPRPTPRCGSRSTTGAGRACRSSSAPASACRSRRPSCGSCSSTRRGSASAAATRRPEPEPARRQARPDRPASG